MKKLQRIIPLLITAALVSAMLTACGDGQPVDTNAVKENEALPIAQEAPVDETPEVKDEGPAEGVEAAVQEEAPEAEPEVIEIRFDNPEEGKELEEPEEVTEEKEHATITLEDLENEPEVVVNSGGLTVAVPEGWVAFQNDTENGTEVMLMESYRTATKEQNGSVWVREIEKADQALAEKDYLDTEDLPSVLTDAGFAYAFRGTSAENEAQVWEIIGLEKEDASYEIRILVSEDGKDTGLDYKADPVTEIIKSIK